MEYIILMDVSGDISPEVAKDSSIRFIPMEYTVGDETRTCKEPESEENLKTFYNGQRNGDLTKTSQIPPYWYESFIKEIFDEGKSVLYLCLSSGLSSTYQSACLAKETLKDDYENFDFLPIDTLAATGGMGVLAERAIRNQKNGMSIQDNYDDLTNSIKNIKHWFVVEDLMYLKRGGRISASTAIIGTALNIRPILIINPEGKLDTVAKKRGDSASLKELVSKFNEEYDPKSGDVVYITHSDSQNKADQLKEEILKLYPDCEVRITGLSPIIGAHTGPGMASICFIGK